MFFLESIVITVVVSFGDDNCVKMSNCKLTIFANDILCQMWMYKQFQNVSNVNCEQIDSKNV